MGVASSGRTLDHETHGSYATDKEDVRHMTAAELDSLGVSIVDKRELILQCKGCGQTWTPVLNADGKACPFDYWLCPRTCNT